MITLLGRLPSQPVGLACDRTSGYVFVAQSNFNNVIAVDVTKRVLVLTFGKGAGNGFGELYYPHGIALDHCGHLLVADKWNERIAVFKASDGTPITSFPTAFQPRSVFVAKNGNVIVGGSKELYMYT